MKKFLAAACAALAIGNAGATTLTPDYSDLWYNASESGWGVNLAQQADTIFLTLFVYGSDNNPVWYVASGMTLTKTATTHTFIGDLYRVTGPFFGATTFNPNSTNVTNVGTATFASTVADPMSGTLTYTVSGITVNKNIVRQNFRNESMTGVFIGGSLGAFTGCVSGNGPSEAVASFTLLQTGNLVRIDEFGGNYTCSYTGAYTQAGRMGRIVGEGTCSSVDGGQPFTASEVEIGSNYFAARFTTNFGNCTFNGRIGGVRRQ